MSAWAKTEPNVEPITQLPSPGKIKEPQRLAEGEIAGNKKRPADQVENKAHAQFATKMVYPQVQLGCWIGANAGDLDVGVYCSNQSKRRK